MRARKATSEYLSPFSSIAYRAGLNSRLVRGAGGMAAST
jgi:hypothetical protein